MNFADNIKRYIVESALKKKNVFNEEFISKTSIMMRVDALRQTKDTYTGEEEQQIIEAFCNLMESFVNSIPIVTIKIDR